MDDTLKTFMDRMKKYIDDCVKAGFAQNQNIDDVLNSNQNGYRSLGTYQAMQYTNTSSQYLVGMSSGSPPVVGG